MFPPLPRWPQGGARALMEAVARRPSLGSGVFCEEELPGLVCGKVAPPAGTLREATPAPGSLASPLHQVP